MQTVSSQELSYRQRLPLEDKLKITNIRIQEWYEYYNGLVYVAFSGGKDSTALLHLVRSLYPDIPAVFNNTGLEFPEIVSFVRSVTNVIWIKPKLSFKQIINKYGYPVISKENSQKIYELRNTKSKKLKNIRLYGYNSKRKSGKLPLKWHYLINAPFKISNRCCNIMKKYPTAKYVSESGRHGFLGTMTCDSRLRMQSVMKYGCNAFDMKIPISRPLSFWIEKNIWEYIKTNNVHYSSIYNMGYTHTGCVFCAFGCHLQDKYTGTNKFKLMKQTHPNLWKYCMEYLNMREVLEYCGVQVEEKYKQLSLF